MDDDALIEQLSRPWLLRCFEYDPVAARVVLTCEPRDGTVFKVQFDGTEDVVLEQRSSNFEVALQVVSMAERGWEASWKITAPPTNDIKFLARSFSLVG